MSLSVSDPLTGKSFDALQDEIVHKLSNSDVLRLAPDIESGKANTLMEATNPREEGEAWENNKDAPANEYYLFKQQYHQIANRYLKEAKQGYILLNTFAKFQKIVESTVLHLKGERSGATFQGRLASGSRELLIRPIVMDTFGMSEGDRERSTGGTGWVSPWIPKTGTYTPSNGKAENKQEIVTLGYMMTTDPTVVESIREQLDDNLGIRPRIDVFSSFSQTDFYFKPRESPFVILNDEAYNMNLIALKNETTDVFPVGVDIITADVQAPTS